MVIIRLREMGEEALLDEELVKHGPMLKMLHHDE